MFLIGKKNHFLELEVASYPIILEFFLVSKNSNDKVALHFQLPCGCFVSDFEETCPHENKPDLHLK